MTRTYTIHLNPYTLSLLNSPNYKKIPNHASTHYAYNIHPTAPIAQNVASAPTHRQMVARKIIPHSDAPAIIAPTTITPTQPTFNPKPYRSKYRNNIDKEALAKYFDNAPSAPDEWLADVVSELDRRDDAHARTADTDMESLRQFVETSRAPNFADDPIYQTNQVYVFVINLSDVIPILLDALAMAGTTPHSEKQKSHAYMMAHPEINAHIADRFVQKYHGADTATAMRALEKQNRNKTKLARMLHQLQITK